MKHALYFSIWVIAGSLGLVAYSYSVDLVPDPRLLQVAWACSLGLSIVIGLLLSGLASRHVPLQADDIQTLKLAVGWAVASAAGWYVSVSVGGTFSGVVTSLVALTIFRTQPFRFLFCAAAGLFGARLGLELPGTGNLFIGAAFCGAAGAGAVAASIWVSGGDRRKILSCAYVIVAWAFAWAISFLIKNNVGMPNLYGYGTNSLELVLAFAIGGLFTPIGKSLLARVVAWGSGGCVAAMVGVGLDLLFSSASSAANVVAFDGTPAYLDVGQAVGMGVGAALAYVWLRSRKQIEAHRIRS